MLQQLGLAELCWPHLAHSGVSASACGDSAAVRVVGVRPSAGAARRTTTSVVRMFLLVPQMAAETTNGSNWRTTQGIET